MNNKEEILKEKRRITQKISFYKIYIGHLIRIAIGSFFATVLFVYLMDIVQINMEQLKISTFSLIFLASLPTMIPLVVSFLFYKQLPELNDILKDIDAKLNSAKL